MVDNMAKEKQFRMPMGMGGLVRYGEEPKQTLKIKPEYVIWLSLFIIFLEVALKFLV